MFQLLEKLQFDKDPSQIFFVGDIHGQHLHLLRDLEKRGFDQETDILIATGDLIDRGPHSRSVLGLLDQPWFFSVAGNHEFMLLDARDNWTEHKLKTHFMNGGAWCRRNVEGATRQFHMPFVENIQEHVSACESMPLQIEFQVGNFKVGVIHTIPRPMKKWPITHPSVLISDFTWGNHRGDFREDYPLSYTHPNFEGVDLVVTGHDSVEKPIVHENVAWMDTYDRSGKFSILNIPDLIDLKKRQLAPTPKIQDDDKWIENYVFEEQDFDDGSE
ncbi:MAG: metallophosphoesterase [Pseudomonadales bacterium]